MRTKVALLAVALIEMLVTTAPLYNTFNRVQFSRPGNSTGNPSTEGYSFGQVGQNDGTTGARQLQLAGKITF